MEDKTEIVFVTKPIAELINKLGEIEAIAAGIGKIVKQFRDGASVEIDDMQYAVTKLTSSFEKHRKEVQDMLDADIAAADASWEICDSKRKTFADKLIGMQPDIERFQKMIGAIKKSIDGLDLYGVDKLFDLIERVNRMSKEDRGILAGLIQLRGNK